MRIYLSLWLSVVFVCCLLSYRVARYWVYCIRPPIYLNNFYSPRYRSQYVIIFYVIAKKYKLWSHWFYFFILNNKIIDQLYNSFSLYSIVFRRVACWEKCSSTHTLWCYTNIFQNIIVNPRFYEHDSLMCCFFKMLISFCYRLERFIKSTYFLRGMNTDKQVCRLNALILMNYI